MDRKKLANLLFPRIKDTPDDLEARYPKRNLPDGAMVTRLGPSPTGFIHLGNLYSALADERLAHRSGGVCFLRIEDTDDKREVEGAVPALLSALHYFGIDFDEGVGAKRGDGRVRSVLPERAEGYLSVLRQAPRGAGEGLSVLYERGGNRRYPRVTGAE
ncbi:MAG: glutamate--tRNA ligase family protein [Anaerovoracaceae bacterium]